MNPSVPNRGMGKYIVFRCGGQTYCIPIEYVEEIVPLAEVLHVPNAPGFLIGFLNIGEESVAVLSLNELVGVPRGEAGLYTPLVLLKTTAPRIALEVDEVIRIVDIDERDLTPIVAECSFNACAAASARLDDQSVLVLSPQKLILEQEKKRIAELAALEERRLAALTPTGVCS